MLANLKAEMARFGVTSLDLAKVMDCTDKTARNKMAGLTDFGIQEAFAIRSTLFPGMSLEYLFADNGQSAQSA